MHPASHKALTALDSPVRVPHRASVRNKEVWSAVNGTVRAAGRLAGTTWPSAGGIASPVKQTTENKIAHGDGNLPC